MVVKGGRSEGVAQRECIEVTGCASGSGERRSAGSRGRPNYGMEKYYYAAESTENCARPLLVLFSASMLSRPSLFCPAYWPPLPAWPTPTPALSHPCS